MLLCFKLLKKHKMDFKDMYYYFANIISTFNCWSISNILTIGYCYSF